MHGVPTRHKHATHSHMCTHMRVISMLLDAFPKGMRVACVHVHVCIRTRESGVRVTHTRTYTSCEHTSVRM